MPSLLTHALRPVAALLLAAALGVAQAEKADRDKQMVIEADRPGTVDLQSQVVVFNGNVSITQGTLVIHADKVELREMPDGYREATAIGTPAKPASYRQKRDGLDETVEGEADRIEFDGRSGTLRFIGDGAVRRLRAGVPADEITGAEIVWDANAEVFSVQGGNHTITNPTGRVRAVLSPHAASAPASAAATGALPLAPTRALGDRR